jgi:hypothetical protein
MTIAITFQFQATGDQVAGWSETYYSSATTTTQAYSVAVSLSVLRNACMSSSVSMPWTRLVPQPLGTGIPVLINNVKDPNLGDQGQLPTTADLQSVKGLLRLIATTGQATRQPFGGIPGNIFGINGAYLGGGAYGAPFKAFLAGLVSNNMCIRKVNNPPPAPPNQGGNFKQPILSISIAGVISAPNNGIPLGALVYVGRVKSGYGLRGFWKVATNDGTNITLLGWTPSSTQIPNTRGQYIQLYGYTYPLIAANPTVVSTAIPFSGIIRSMKHSVGRPKNPTTGRRKRPVK